jgi:hypothetical protein
MIYPNPQSQEGVLVAAFGRGESLTTLDALNRYQIMALSQRCTRLRQFGWPVQSELVRTASGKHIKRYWL